MTSTLALISVLAVVLPIVAAGCWLGLCQPQPHDSRAREGLSNSRR